MKEETPVIPIEIIWRNPAELRLYENNPRKHGEDNINAIIQSFKENGVLLPVLINASDMVVKGSGCVMAALKMALPRIPCIQETHLTEEQARAFRMVDNRTAELATWDYMLQAEELAAIANIDLSAFQFPDFTAELDVKDEDFLTGESHQKDQHEKTAVCPNCGHEFKL